MSADILKILQELHIDFDSLPDKGIQDKIMLLVNIVEQLGLKRMKPKTDDAANEIISLQNYLTGHQNRVNYGAARRGGYHIGSGAIESANKFIGHVRLKRSGAWWYRSFANKLRCAKYNGTYDRIIEKHKEKKRAEIYPPLRSL